MTKAKKVLSIDGSVAPQLFTIKKDKFIFFEKVNPEEGRFFTLNKNKIDLICDTKEAQGIIEGGDMYTISIGENTIIKRIENEPITLNIKGAYFDFKVDNNKNIICLGHNGVKSIIKIFSASGEEIKTIEINDLLFASSIKVYEDDIWISGFDDKNNFKLIKINYIGYLLEKFSIEADADERLISKIQIYKDNIYMIIGGKKDSIYILNKNGKKIKEVFPRDIGLEEFVDYEVRDDNIYILNSKKIHVFNLNDLIKIKDKFRLTPPLGSNIKVPYGYFMILESLKSSFWYGMLLGIIVYTFMYQLRQWEIPIINSLSYIWILGIFISLAISLVNLGKKDNRIIYLLKIQSRRLPNRILRVALIAITIFSIATLLFIENFRIIDLIVLAMIFICIIFIDNLFKGYLNNKREDIVVELLPAEKGLNESLKSLINSSLSGNKILLNVKVEKDFNKKYLSKWNDSRGFILGENINYIFMDKTFISVVDFSKRDIKYSKVSILADLICYIGAFGSIKEVNAMWVD